MADKVEELRSQWREILETEGGTTAPRSLIAGTEPLTTYRGASDVAASAPVVDAPPPPEPPPDARVAATAPCERPRANYLVPLIVVVLGVFALLILYITRSQRVDPPEDGGMRDLDLSGPARATPDDEDDDELVEIDRRCARPTSEHEPELPRASLKEHRGEQRVTPTPDLGDKQHAGAHDPMFQTLNRLTAQPPA